MYAKHDTVMQLLANGGEYLLLGDTGLYCCIAVEQNNIQLLDEMLHRINDANRPSKDENVSLHRAVCNRNIEMVELLLKYGADIDKQDSNGWTPRRTLAEQQGHAEIQYLFKPVTAPRKYTSNGRVTPMLLGRFNIDKQDSNGWTPRRTLAEQQGHAEIQYLFKPVTTPRKYTSNGRVTPMLLGRFSTSNNKFCSMWHMVHFSPGQAFI